MPQWNSPADRGLRAYEAEPLRLAPGGCSVVVWLVIGVVAGVGLLALLDPGSVDVLIATEL
jgi:hypothetical protein